MYFSMIDKLTKSKHKNFNLFELLKQPEEI